MKLSRSIFAVTLALPIIGLAAIRLGTESGIKVGGEVYAFEPTHVTGPDKGTDTCPVCKYGKQPAAQVWVNGDDTANVIKLAKGLEADIEKNGLKKFRAFVVFIPSKGESDAQIESKLQSIAKENELKNVALTFVHGGSRDAIEEYKINTDASVKNTVMVYANRSVVANFVNLQGNEEGISKLDAAVNEAVGKVK